MIRLNWVCIAACLGRQMQVEVSKFNKDYLVLGNHCYSVHTRYTAGGTWHQCFVLVSPTLSHSYLLSSKLELISCNESTVCRVPCMTVYITHPWGGFPRSIARQLRGCRYRTITSSESSRRDVSNANLVGTDTTPTVEMSSMENRPRGV